MKWAFAWVFLAMVGLSLVAWRYQPAPAPSGEIPLTLISDNNPLRQGQVALFNQLHPGLDLMVDPSGGDLQKVIVQSIGGVGPDVFDCSDPYQLTAYVRSGVAMDVTQALKERGIDVARDAFPGILTTGILNGRVYGVPTNISADGVWFHKDLFDAAGIPYPKGSITWSQMIPLAERLTTRDKTGKITRYGLLFPWWNWRHFLYGFGGRVFTSDGRRCILDSPQDVAAIQMMYDLTYKYHVSPTPAETAGMAGAGGFGSDDSSLFANKRVAMAIGGRWWLSTLRQSPGLHLGVFESPYGTVREFRAYGRFVLVNRESHHIPQALSFLAYLAGPEYNRLIAAQADGIPAFKKYAYGPQFLYNPSHPEEDYNAVWREIASRAIGDESSPFVDGNLAAQLFQKQLDLVQSDAKSPQQAMSDAARDINAAMQKNLQDDPALAARYRAGGP